MVNDKNRERGYDFMRYWENNRIVLAVEIGDDDFYHIGMSLASTKDSYDMKNINNDWGTCFIRVDSKRVEISEDGGVFIQLVPENPGVMKKKGRQIALNRLKNKGKFYFMIPKSYVIDSKTNLYMAFIRYMNEQLDKMMLSENDAEPNLANLPKWFQKYIRDVFDIYAIEPLSEDVKG